MLALERHSAALVGVVKDRRDDRILANVLGDIFFGVVRAHLFLIDVLLEDVAENVGVDFTAGFGRAIIEMPVVALEIREKPVERGIGDVDLFPVYLFDLMF